MQAGLEREFKKTVSIGELTLFQSDLTKNQGIVLTTKAVYLLQKRWWKIKCTPLPLKEIQNVRLKDREQIEFTTNSGSQYTLKIAQEHFPQAVKGINRILELMNK